MTAFLIICFAALALTLSVGLTITFKQHRDHNKILDGVCPDCENALVQTECHCDEKDHSKVTTEYLCTCCGNRFEIIETCE